MANIAKFIWSLLEGVLLLLSFACLTAAGSAQGLSDADITAAFGERPATAKDWQSEVEEIVETKDEPAFRFTLPFGRDPFVPTGLRRDTQLPSQPASAPPLRFSQGSYSLKGTWRQLGGAWQAIIQDVAGEPIVVAVGDRVGDAEVLAITATEVKLRWADVALDGKAQFRQLTLAL